jgi:hypothetical protein
MATVITSYKLFTQSGWVESSKLNIPLLLRHGSSEMYASMVPEE